MTTRVRTRIAPSPTGDPHVGTAYMALFNMVFARHHHGDFILRIEDTDQKRSRLEYEQNIYRALRWCGLDWSEGPDVGGPYGPYKQSERTELYQSHTKTLLDKGCAYKCFCTGEELAQMREEMGKSGRIGYDRRCRNLTPEQIAEKEQQGLPFVVRLKVPLSGDCIYTDLIKGRVCVPYADVDDQVLLKSDGFPTYHLAVVVDDHLMAISHVIRGDEWMSSTPKHICLYEAFGWEPPQFLHMPLLLGLDGKKLSKRKNPTSIFFFRDCGYLKEAFINFLSLMGYSMGDQSEIYSLQKLIDTFDAKRIGTSGAIFDTKRLDWLNQQYLINHIAPEQLWQSLREWNFSDEYMSKIMPLVHPRIKTFGEFIELCDFFFVNHLSWKEELFMAKGQTKTFAAMVLQTMIWALDEGENWGSAGFSNSSRLVAEAFGVHHKKVVMPLLFACLTGRTQAPPLFDSAEILGKDRCRARFLGCIEFLGGLSKKTLAQLEKSWQKKDCKDLQIL